MNDKEVDKQLGVSPDLSPVYEYSQEETKWVTEKALYIHNSKMEGEDFLAAYARHDYPISLKIREEVKRLFPESDWSKLTSYLFYEVCRLNNALPLWK